MKPLLLTACLLLWGCTLTPPSYRSPYAVDDPELVKFFVQHPEMYEAYRQGVDDILRAPAPGESRRAQEEPETHRQRRSESFAHKVYSADECTGPVVAGVCHGAILPKSAYHPTCYGEMLNGQCTGPLF